MWWWGLVHAKDYVFFKTICDALFCFVTLFSDKLDDTISKDPYLNYGLVYFLMSFVVGVLA